MGQGNFCCLALHTPNQYRGEAEKPLDNYCMAYFRAWYSVYSSRSLPSQPLRRLRVEISAENELALRRSDPSITAAYVRHSKIGLLLVFIASMKSLSMTLGAMLDATSYDSE